MLGCCHYKAIRKSVEWASIEWAIASAWGAGRGESTPGHPATLTTQCYVALRGNRPLPGITVVDSDAEPSMQGCRAEQVGMPAQLHGP